MLHVWQDVFLQPVTNVMVPSLRALGGSARAHGHPHRESKLSHCVLSLCPGTVSVSVFRGDPILAPWSQCL